MKMQSRPTQQDSIGDLDLGEAKLLGAITLRYAGDLLCIYTFG
jgi:hypothetical protein